MNLEKFLRERCVSFAILAVKKSEFRNYQINSGDYSCKLLLKNVNKYLVIFFLNTLNIEVVKIKLPKELFFGDTFAKVS